MAYFIPQVLLRFTSYLSIVISCQGLQEGEKQWGDHLMSLTWSSLLNKKHYPIINPCELHDWLGWDSLVITLVAVWDTHVKDMGKAVCVLLPIWSPTQEVTSDMKFGHTRCHFKFLLLTSLPQNILHLAPMCKSFGRCIPHLHKRLVSSMAYTAELFLEDVMKTWLCRDRTVITYMSTISVVHVMWLIYETEHERVILTYHIHAYISLIFETK